MPPAIFRKSYEQPESSSNDDSLQDEIGRRSKTSATKLKKQKSPSGITMNHSQSSSDDDGVIDIAVGKRKESLKKN